MLEVKQSFEEKADTGGVSAAEANADVKVLRVCCFVQHIVQGGDKLRITVTRDLHKNGVGFHVVLLKLLAMYL